MANSMMPVVAQLPGVRWSDSAPLLILGFDATDALCVMANGALEYVNIGNIRVDWTYDQEAQVWTSTVGDVEDDDPGALAAGSGEDEITAGRDRASDDDQPLAPI